MNLILLGPPGAGKGTQAQKIIDSFKIPQLSVGDILRENRDRKTELGLKAASFMDKGLLVPDDLIINLMRARIRMADCKTGFILDGFPRTVGQADALAAVLQEDKKSISRVVSFVVPFPTLVKRLTGRRSCKKCGSIWHLEFNPPKKAGVCNCGAGDLLQRPDDREEVISERIKTYEASTAPLIKYYKERNLLTEVDATLEVDVIGERVIEILKGLKKG